MHHLHVESKKLHKWICLQNRNRLTDTEKELRVTKGGNKGERQIRSLGVTRPHTIYKIIDKDLLCSTGHISVSCNKLQWEEEKRKAQTPHCPSMSIFLHANFHVCIWTFTLFVFPLFQISKFVFCYFSQFLIHLQQKSASVPIRAYNFSPLPSPSTPNYKLYFISLACCLTYKVPEDR